MIDSLGHVLLAWLVPVNAWTCVLVVGAALVDRTLGHRMRASLRMALYAPVALRVLVPLSWSIPTLHVPSVAAVLPLDALTASAPSRGVSWYAAAAVAYVAIAAGLALRSVVRRRSLARALASARVSAGTDAPYPVLAHDELGPMVAGVVAPSIVLPQAMLDAADARALACVLKHEVAHVRRGDPWLAAAIELLLVVAWPVAPLWIAAARVRHLMELACDEAALEGADAAERRRYGHVLLDVAEQRTVVAALHFGATLRARIEAISEARPWPRALQASVVVAAVAAFAACSAAGPEASPRATGTARGASSAGLDQYGYQFEDDAVKNGQPTPNAPTKNAQGRLAPEAIQSVVRASFGAYRKCYESGLQANAKLAGVVSVSFVILPDGSVQNAVDHGSTLPDANVVECVVGGFRHLAFPPPQGGYVTVVYPIEFRPGD